jgi:hypothetical protein
VVGAFCPGWRRERPLVFLPPRPDDLPVEPLAVVVADGPFAGTAFKEALLDELLEAELFVDGVVVPEAPGFFFTGPFD